MFIFPLYPQSLISCACFLKKAPPGGKHLREEKIPSVGQQRALKWANYCACFQSFIRFLEKWFQLLSINIRVSWSLKYSHPVCYSQMHCCKWWIWEQWHQIQLLGHLQLYTFTIWSIGLNWTLILQTIYMSNNSNTVVNPPTLPM